MTNTSYKLTQASLSPRKPTNSQRWHPNAQILWEMWPSHTSSNTNPRTSDYRTPKSDPRTNGKTHRNRQNDPRMHIEILLPWLSKTNQTIVTTMRRLNQIQKNQQKSDQTKKDQQYRTRPGTGRHFRNRHITEPTKFSRIPKHCNDDRCILKIPFCIPNAEYYSENIWTMYCRCHDETRISANANPIG